MTRLQAIAAFFVLFVAPFAYGAEQKFNLPDKPEGPRFEVTDRLWPERHGDAHVCLWADDKVAAVSLSIDDNVVQQHGWWREQLEPRGWNMTWFVITDHVVEKPDFFGPWSAFQTLHDLGYDIQSHSKTHGHICEAPGTPCDLDIEYGDAVIAIEENVKDAKVLTMAYTGVAINFEHDPGIAAKYYIAARWKGGGRPDPPNQIYYMQTRAGEWFPSWVPGGCLEKMLEKHADERWHSFYRGWMNRFWHGHNGDETIRELEMLEANEDRLWITNFTNAVIYNIEYVTHRLEVTTVSSDVIRFTLSDDMADAIYTYPLTVKIRIDNSWSDATVIQGTQIRESKIITGDNGLNYLLTKAMPDKGAVEVRKAGGSTPSTVSGTVILRVR